MKTKKPLYVIAADYDEKKDIFNSFCLGWSNVSDWYDTNSADNLLTPAGNLRNPKNDLIVSVAGGSCIYASSDPEKLRKYAENAARNGIDCTVCEVKLDDATDEHKLVPAA